MSPWEKTVFGGRTSRMGFWIGLVGVYVLLLLSFVPFNLLGGALGVCSSSFSKALLAVCLVIPGFLLLRISGRRLHDLGWPGWLALVLPMLFFIEGDVMRDGARYYCDVGLLSPIHDVLSRSAPLQRSLDILSPLFTPFSFTLNGMEVDFVAIGFPILLYLGLYPGMQGKNRYGVDPWDKLQVAAADATRQEPLSPSAAPPSPDPASKDHPPAPNSRQSAQLFGTSSVRTSTLSFQRIFWLYFLIPVIAIIVPAIFSVVDPPFPLSAILSPIRALVHFMGGQNFLIMITVIILSICGLTLRGVWTSSRNYNGHKFWTVLAKGIIIIVALYSLYALQDTIRSGI